MSTKSVGSWRSKFYLTLIKSEQVPKESAAPNNTFNYYNEIAGVLQCPPNDEEKYSCTNPNDSDNDIEMQSVTEHRDVDSDNHVEFPIEDVTLIHSDDCDYSMWKTILTPSDYLRGTQSTANYLMGQIGKIQTQFWGLASLATPFFGHGHIKIEDEESNKSGKDCNENDDDDELNCLLLSSK